MKRLSRLHVVPALLSGLALALFSQNGALAAETDASALREQIESLTSRVKALEQEVKQLEQRSSAPAVAPAVSAPGQPAAVPFREAWRGIHDGLARDEVKKLLGAPQHEFMLSGKRVWYYYYSGEGGGSVFFGEDGRVAGSQAPPRPW